MIVLYATSFNFVLVSRLASRFPNIIPQQKVDELEEQMLDLKVTPVDELQISLTDDIDAFWGALDQVKEPFSDKNRFGTLCNLAKALLVLPISNADAERAFSILKKIHTESRSELTNETICAVMSVKINQPTNCIEFTPESELLASAKAAASVYNEQKAWKELKCN